jgi:hypothetical protein
VPLGQPVSSGIDWHSSVAATQLSMVQATESSQLGIPEATQRPPSQATVPLQKMPSSGQSASVVQVLPPSPPSVEPPSPLGPGRALLAHPAIAETTSSNPKAKRIETAFFV